jgi:uncharacterized sulfatase
MTPFDTLHWLKVGCSGRIGIYFPGVWLNDFFVAIIRQTVFSWVIGGEMRIAKNIAIVWLCLAVTFFVAVTPDMTRGSEKDSRPNVILIFIDDLGWQDFSCFGNKDVQTPHIDQLAKEGIAFENFYVNSPICSPSRTAISTGTYPQRWNITSYLAHRSANNKRGMANWLSPAAPMLARSLQKSGYATGHFGKWHMGGQRDVSDAPEISEYGFDVSLTNFEGLGAKLLPLTLRPDGREGRIWDKAESLGGPVTWMQRSKITGGFVDAAIAFMTTSVEKKKPFYINLWPDDMHSPFWPPVDKWGDGSTRQKYLGVLESMDEQLGVLLEYVRSQQALINNTLILVCSDNGPEKGAGRTGGFKGYKTQLYEGGVRSPLISWGPGLVHGGGMRNTESVFSAIDLVPSLQRLCGVRKDSLCDGEDILDALVGKEAQSRKAPLFFSRPPDRKNFYDCENLPDLAVRKGKWKLLCDYDGSRPELHNIIEDPAESVNLADKEPAIVQNLIRITLEWYRTTNGSHMNERASESSGP